MNNKELYNGLVISKEVWKDLDLTYYGGEDYTGHYQISNLGRIKSLNSIKITKIKELQKRMTYYT